MLFMCSSLSGLHCTVCYVSVKQFTLYYKFKQSCIGSTRQGNSVYQASVFVPLTLLAMFAHLCACCGLQCNYRSLNKRFQDLLVQLYQIHATCKCVFLLIFIFCHTQVWSYISRCTIHILFFNTWVVQCQFIFLKVNRGDLISKH